MMRPDNNNICLVCVCVCVRVCVWSQLDTVDGEDTVGTNDWDITGRPQR